MRSYLWVLVALVVLFVVPANAAQLPTIESRLAESLEEVRKFDIQIASLQASWDKEAARIEESQFSVQEKQAAQDKAREKYAEKQAWLKFNRRQKTVESLDVLAQMYQYHSSTLFWSEGRAQSADSDINDNTSQTVRLAKNDAIDKAAKKMSDKISPPAICTLLDLAPVVISMEQVAADTSAGFGEPVQVKRADGVVIETRARLQVKPVTSNPYTALAEARRLELKIARLELLRQFPILVDSTLTWDGKVITVKKNGEAIQEKPLISLAGVVGDGQLRLNKETLDRGFSETSGVSCQLQLTLKLPEGINGDEARLEVVFRDREPKNLKRVVFSLQGIEGAALYEYQSFTPPIITLTAGLTSQANSRMRVGESILRFDIEKPGRATVETKSGEMATYSSGKLTRKILYDGKLGQLKSLSLTMPSSIMLDSVKLYDSGVLVMSEEFNQDGRSNVRLNSEHLTKQ